MILDTLYIRFFRSFNYDYLRKSDPRAKPDHWDYLNGRFYPFVRIHLEKGITTIVGANESGKSQLLAALKHLLTGEGIEPRDFCRYSKFFTVDKQMVKPEFGGKFTNLTSDETEALRAVSGLESKAKIESFLLFRINEGIFLYLPSENDQSPQKLETSHVKRLKLPTYFQIDADVPLPDSVPLDYLVENKTSKTGKSRQKMLRGQEALRENLNDLLGGQPPQIQAIGTKLLAALNTGGDGDEDPHLAKRLTLAETLLVQVAGIDRTAFKELQQAVKKSEGYANGLVERMNKQLAEKLNFPKWWSQDRDFSLYLTLRDFDLVFTVKDRTGSDYSFSERSDGMKYFLSYFVQYLSYNPKSDHEILLMDEPDRFLSTSGQNDLLRIFAQFAAPDNPNRQGVQVVYVTHSPFLIDKNHSDRIRVLEKGEGEEGTRVVRNAARNHYEPLRSAFGSFVAETTFIGNCNLMMEGQADQILLANISTLVREQYPQKESLDLNMLTLVPSGSAEHIPYMVYLARGRDVDQPALIVLLDGDQAGEHIRKELGRGYRGRKLIEDEFVLTTKDLPDSISTSTTSVQEIEDLIPAEIATEAIRRVADEVLTPEDASRVKAALKSVKPQKDEKLFKAASKAAAEASPDVDRPLRLDKVAFARAVTNALKDNAPATEAAIANFSTLFGEINLRQRAANRRNSRERFTSALKRLRSAFLADHPHNARKTEVQAFLEDVESQLSDTSDETESIRAVIRRIRHDHSLATDPSTLIDNFEGLRTQIESMTYGAVRQAQN